MHCSYNLLFESGFGKKRTKNKKYGNENMIIYEIEGKKNY